MLSPLPIPIPIPIFVFQNRLSEQRRALLVRTGLTPPFVLTLIFSFMKMFDIALLPLTLTLSLSHSGVDVNKKLRVCDVCGSFLSIMDSDKYVSLRVCSIRALLFYLQNSVLAPCDDPKICAA